MPKDPEPETLISGRTVFGGYGALVVSFTELNDDFGVLVGGRGGLIINHAFVIGGGGYGLANEVDVIGTPPRDNSLLDFGYGGVLLGYVIGSRKLLHLSIHTLIGAGGACLRTGIYDVWYDDDAFFVAEPGVDLILNVTKHFRMGVGGSYRYVYGVDLDGLSDGDLSGPSASMIFKVGSF
jgi:hypothetical protein